jgi:hypothetical protein
MRELLQHILEQDIFKPASKEEVRARKSPSTLLEDFLDYCEDSVPGLGMSIKTQIGDYFDLSNREIPLSADEIAWIKANLSLDSQIEILGQTIQ